MDIWNHKQKILKFVAPWLIVIASSFLFTRNLGREDLTMWDEVIHINVVKNLTEHCCAPTLALAPWGTFFNDWSNTTIWLHKPLLPFYISAASFALFGKTVFAFRLPTLVAFEFLIISVFWFGRRYFNYWVGLLAALLLAFNIYSFQLVSGTQFSGLGDIGFALCALLTMAAAMEILDKPRPLWFILAGFSFACGYFFKGGLAVIPTGLLVLLMLVYRQKFSYFLKLGLSGAIFLLPIAFVSFYLNHRFPAEYAFEQAAQLAHLWKNVEGWSRPFDYYLTVYWPFLVGPGLLSWFYFSVASGLSEFKRQPKMFVLTLFSSGFLVLLSFAVSKVPNFIYAGLAPSVLLISAAVCNAWQSRRFAVLSSLSLTSIIIYFILRFNIGHIQTGLFVAGGFSRRASLLAVTFLVWAACFVLTNYLIRPLKTSRVTAVLTAICLILIVWSNIHSDWKATVAKLPSSDIQESLRLSAPKVSSLTPAGGTVLVNQPELYRSNLYLQFWSGLPTQEVDAQRPVSYWLTQIPVSVPVILLSSSATAEFKLIAQVQAGFIYRVR